MILATGNIITTLLAVYRRQMRVFCSCCQSILDTGTVKLCFLFCFVLVVLFENICILVKLLIIDRFQLALFSDFELIQCALVACGSE